MPAQHMVPEVQNGDKEGVSGHAGSSVEPPQFVTSEADDFEKGI